MNYLLLFLTTFAASGKALICKKIGSDNRAVGNGFLLNSGIFFVASLMMFAAALINGGGRFSVSPYSVIMGVVFGAMTSFTQLTQIAAMSRGAASLTTLIYSMGFIIPTVWSHFALGERISPWQLVGVGVMLAALYMIINPRGGKASFSWLFFSLLSMTGSGINAIIQKLHQHSPSSSESFEFLFFTFLFAGAICFSRSLFSNSEKSDSVHMKTVLFTVFSGVCIGGLNLLNLTLAGRLPAVIHFPIYNVGNMMLTGLFSAVFFRERVTRIQLFGFITGCVATLIIGLL